MTDVTKPDRRVERTRQALLLAFRDLLMERGYDAFAVRDIVERANVGRSTFYEHFEGKEDIFRESLTAPVRALATGTCEPGRLDKLTMIVEHFWEQRVMTQAIVRGDARRVMSGLLADFVAEYVAKRAHDAGRAPSIPLRLAAEHLAEAQLGLLESWLAHEAPCDAATLARALSESTQASMTALTG